MEFNFTDEQAQFRREWRDYLESNLPDGWASGGRHEIIDDEAGFTEFQREWQRQLYEDGWAGPNWPEEYGGMGLSVIEEMIYEHERIRADAPNPPGAGPPLVGPTLMQVGSEWQKDRFVPKMLSGEELWSQGYSEPEHGSDIAGLECTAEQNGDEFVINGQKIWNTYGRIADYCITMCRTDSSGVKHEGITALIIDMDQAGVEVQDINQINKKQDFSQVFFDDAVASEKYVVGEVDEGWDVIRTMSAFEQSWTRAFDAERRLNEIIQYCQTNKRNGQTMTEEPSTRRELARLDMRTQATKLTRYRQISERIDNPIPGPEGSLDVVKGDDLIIDIEEFGLDMVGPEATLWEDGLDGGRRTEEWLFWLGLWIGGGTGDVQRNIIGEEVLGLPKDIKSQYSHRPESERPDPSA